MLRDADSLPGSPAKSPARGLLFQVGRLVTLPDGLRLESVYLLVALVFGVLFAILTPPFQVPDEPWHYLRAWSVAQGQVIAGDDLTVLVPRNVAELPGYLGSGMIDWSQNTYSVRSALGAMAQPVGSRDVRVFTSAASNGVLSYLPELPAIGIARFLGRSPLAALYGARLLNLLVGVLLTYFAIRLAPFGKPLFAFVGLLPMTIAQTASLSPDAVAIAGAFFFTALVLRMAVSARVGGAEIVGLALSGAVLLNVKSGYAVLGVLVLAIPVARFGSRKAYAAGVAATLGAAALVAGAQFLTPPVNLAASRRGIGPGFQGQPDTQMAFITHHPWDFAKVLLSTLDTQSLPLTKQVVGVLGWLTVALPETLIVAALLVLLVLFARQDTVILAWWQRCVLAGGALLGALMVMSGIYVGWTPPLSSEVLGLQGRYFTPCIPAALLALYGLPMTRRFVAPAVVIGIVVVVALVSIAGLVSFYY